MRQIDLVAAAVVAGPMDLPVRTRLTGSGAALDPDAVVEILRANKVPLLDIDPAGLEESPELADLLRSVQWKKTIDRERAERDALAAAFSGLSVKLAALGITPVLFK